ncbi:MAG: recombinase RecT [Limosilactobacillus mucosae]|jgi:recombination protein RecT|nr:RecT family recombinase [Limosilactobacillus mucosae]MCI6052041.1 recombinase RecT [Limosilactobacillus mucosae]MDY5413956.1 RecT family recombinase [Limosilactobacillus mucosae]
MTNQSNQMAVMQKDITDQVSNRISQLQDDGLALPKDYNPQNALKAAWFKLQQTKDRSNRPALQVCTRSSIANALLDMVTQGLSPAKTQCYFIVYGNEVQLQRSYFGTIAAVKRLSSVKDIDAQVVHQGDEFAIGADELGRIKVTKFVPKFENLDKPIKGAFAFIELADGRVDYTVMTQKQIQTSWGQSRQHNVQQKFGDEMAKRTVINRAAKMYINTSDDSDLLTGSINTVTANEYEDEPERKDVTPETPKSTADKLVQGFKKEQAQIHEEEKQAAEKAPEQESVKESEQDGNQEADGQTDIFDYIEDDQADEK